MHLYLPAHLAHTCTHGILYHIVYDWMVPVFTTLILTMILILIGSIAVYLIKNLKDTHKDDQYPYEY